MRRTSSLPAARTVKRSAPLRPLPLVEREIEKLERRLELATSGRVDLSRRLARARIEKAKILTGMEYTA